MLSDEEKATKKITIFYCTVSSVASVTLTLILIYSEVYVYLGNRKIIPLFFILIILEVVKWCFQIVAFENAYNSLLKKRTNLNLLIGSIAFSDTIRSILALSISCVTFYIVAVLFGAEVLNNQEETFMFSILLTSLTVLPILIQFGSNYVEIFFQCLQPKNEFESLVFKNSYGTLLGSWFGAFLIPLDWDRPWQVWPIPCSLGALLGYSVSNVLQLLALPLRTYKKKYI